MSVASWCSFADDSRTPKGVSELRSRCWMWAVGRPCWLLASERRTAPAYRLRWLFTWRARLARDAFGRPRTGPDWRSAADAAALM